MVFTFRDYQKKDVNFWAANNYRGGWFWDPGLGKTTCAIIVVRRMLEKGITKRILVVAPAALTKMWNKDLIANKVDPETVFRVKDDDVETKISNNKATPEILEEFGVTPESLPGILDKTLPLPEQVLISKSDTQIVSKRLNLQKGVLYKQVITKTLAGIITDKHRIVIVSYNMLNGILGDKAKLAAGEKIKRTKNSKAVTPPSEFTLFRKLPKDFDLYVLDESHNIKNHQSCNYKILSGMITTKDKLLVMSGTPFPNGLEECFTTLNLLNPGLVGYNISQFRNKYCYLYKPDYFIYKTKPDKEAVLKQYIQKYCSMRHLEEEVELPELTVIKLDYTLSEEQRECYKQLIYDNVIETEVEGTKYIPVPLPAIRLLLMQQINSGYVDMKLSIKAMNMEFHASRTDLNTEKLEVLAEKLRAIPENRQALIWITFKKTAAVVYAALRHEFPIEVITGDTPQKERDRITKAYAEKKVRFIIAHPATLGTGLNIFIGTNYMFWYEATFDYMQYTQAVGRIKRIGQKSQMFVYHFVSDAYSGSIGSIDDKIIEAIDQKKSVLDYLYDQSGLTGLMTKTGEASAAY